MRIIIDTNQAGAVVGSMPNDERCHPTLVIPPLVWAEILLSPPHYHQGRIKAITRYDVLFGMDVPIVYDCLSRLSERDIRAFDPVFTIGSYAHELLRTDFVSPRAAHHERARQLKQTASKDADDLALRLRQYRKESLDSRSRGEDLAIGKCYTTIEEADERFISGSNAPWRKSLLDGVTKGGTRPLRASSADSFCAAVLANSVLRRFLRTVIAFDLGYANYWADQRLNNIDVSANRNDFTDTTLALYARDGDMILTNDSYFRTAFRHVDHEARVRLATWAEVVQGRTAT